MNHPTPNHSMFKSGSQPNHRGIPAAQWQACSRIFAEGRRIRSLAADMRELESCDLTPAARHAVEQYRQALDAAAALGDVVAEALVSRAR